MDISNVNKSPSYKEMIQRMKKCQAQVDELQEKSLDLQVQFAESHMVAAQLFDPQVVEMMAALDKLLSAKGVARGSPSNSKDDEMDTGETLEDKYGKMGEEVDEMFQN